MQGLHLIVMVDGVAQQTSEVLKGKCLLSQNYFKLGTDGDSDIFLSSLHDSSRR